MTAAGTGEQVATGTAGASNEAGFLFLRGGARSADPLSWSRGPDEVRKAVGEALNARNVAFLVGAGCSSMWQEGAERGIPTMAPLAEEFCSYPRPEEWTDDLELVVAPAWALDAADIALLERIGAKLPGSEYERNLERLMELLHSLRFVYARSGRAEHAASRAGVETIIGKVQSFIWERCTTPTLDDPANPVLRLYETFYRKLVLRDRSLPRPWVFTTNYDLFGERAMDRLGLPYANGFSGVVERRFNPASFRYALAEQLDLSSRRWSAVDGFVYLCKLHGSISWTEDDHGLYPVREQWPSDKPAKVMIYPTPAKQNSSLGSPYADLFREFQSRIVQEQSVLVTMGFAFGDEHLNNIVYQALTVPTFRLIVFADPNGGGEIARLRALDDPRIWIIGGDGPTPGSKAHYFDTVVEHFLPQRPVERIDEAVRAVLEGIRDRKAEAQALEH